MTYMIDGTQYWSSRSAGGARRRLLAFRVGRSSVHVLGEFGSHRTGVLDSADAPLLPAPRARPALLRRPAGTGCTSHAGRPPASGG